MQVFRATHGKAKVWGKNPTYITAKYTPADGQEKTSLLLTDGKTITLMSTLFGLPYGLLSTAKDSSPNRSSN